MANDLTGDYEAVAAFSLGAVSRILAAMHRGKRLPHSLSMAVDDIPELRLGAVAVSAQRQISRAYGITIWPTVVFLDRNGIVEDIHFGLIPEPDVATLESKPASQPGKADAPC